MAKLVLSLDGGGIRGAATAEFLKLLEKKLGRSLYETFDMFAGTSTGGIIAVALGVAKMKGPKIAELYNYKNGNTIMNKSTWDRMLGVVQTKPKYNGKGKRKVLREYFGKRLLSSAKKPTLVVTYDVVKRKSAVLKSTDKKRILAVDAVDATSAAPTYFPTAKVGQKWLIDGGVIANNPAMCAYAEACKMWPGKEIKVLSVGTGSNTRAIDGKASQGYGALEWFRHDLLGIVMDESVVEYQMKTIMGKKKYLRVNSTLDYVNDDMDDCSHGNIDNLKRLGKEWFERFGDQAKELLS